MSGGYIAYAHKQGIEINYKEAKPTQWWHLLESYCARTNEEKVFGKSIKCGELLVWMAEVLECVEKDKLADLVDRIIASAVHEDAKGKKLSRPKYDRRKWNKEIQDLCFEAIKDKVEKLEKENEK